MDGILSSFVHVARVKISLIYFEINGQNEKLRQGQMCKTLGLDFY